MFGTSAGVIGTNSNHPFELRTNNLQRVVLGSTGQVTINAPSTSGFSLIVHGDPSSDVAWFGFNHATATRWFVVSNTNTASTAGAGFLCHGTGSAGMSFLSMVGTTTGVCGTMSNHPFELRTNNIARVILSAPGVVSYVTSDAGTQEVGFRNIPRVTTSLVRGACRAITSGITIPTSAEGDVFSVYNNSASSVTLTQGSGLTMRLAGSTSTGDRTLAARGLATIWYNSASEAIIYGPGVS